MKCYRNVQTLIEELKQKVDTTEIGYNSMKTLKGYFRIAIVLAALNLAGILGIAAHLLGWF